MTEQEAKWVEDLRTSLAKEKERKTEARKERNEYISKLRSFDDETVGKAFKAFTYQMQEGKLPELDSEEIAVAHDLIAEIIFLDYWEC